MVNQARAEWIRHKLILYMPTFLLVLAVLLAYGNVAHNEFFFDDEFLIVKNRFLRSWSSALDILRTSSTGGARQTDNFYRPVQILLYLFVYQVAGLSTTAFHVLNIVLHLSNVLLVRSLGQRLGFLPGAAWVAALLWAVHPIHTEAVTYMSATADPAHTLFCLLGLCVWLTPTLRFSTALALSCFALGLLSKEPAIVFPALAMVCRFAVEKPDRRWRPRIYLGTWPFWLLAGVYLWMRHSVLDFDHTFEFYKRANIYSENWLYRLYTFLATLPSYLELLLWPRTLVMERNFPVFIDWREPVFWGATILLAGTAITIKERRSEPPIGGFAFLWFLAAYAPQSGVLVAVNALFLEHWMYLPTVGMTLGITQSAAALFGKPFLAKARWPPQIAVGALLVCVTVALAFRTRAQNLVWRDPKTFYQHVLTHNPRDARAMNNLAMAYSDDHDDTNAEAYYRRAIELSDVYPQSHYNLALLLLSRGQRLDAIEELKRALVIDPNFAYARTKLDSVVPQP